MKFDHNTVRSNPWWDYLDEDLQELISASALLLEKVSSWEDTFHDYSFVVFPAAKAYEGFLKKVLLDINLISENDYYGKRFRIGKALNPELRGRIRKKVGVYDKLVAMCGGEETPRQLWETWRESRNLLFHWFPNEANAIALSEAEERLDLIFDAINKAYSLCTMKGDGNEPQS